MKVLIIDYLTETTIERKVIGDNASLICLRCTEESELPELINEADAVLLYHHVELSAATLRKMRSCRLIVRAGVGFDNVDIRAAGELGIPVVNVPDYGTNDVADHAVALLLSLVRKIPEYHDRLRDDPVSNWKPDVSGEIYRLTNASIGIVGLGRIGTAVALRAKAFGMDVSFYDPFIGAGWDKSLGLRRHDTLEDLVSSCTFISIHAPLTHLTRSMFDENLLRNAKNGLTLINVSRGEIVSLDAVFEALSNGKLKAFGADVLEKEPPHPEHPLIAAYRRREPFLNGRMLLTPHMGFYALESREELRTRTAEHIRDLLTDRPVKNCVNLSVLRNSRARVSGYNSSFRVGQE